MVIVRSSVRSEAGYTYPASGQPDREKQHLIWIAGFSLALSDPYLK